MAGEPLKSKRVLYLKIRTPSADAGTLLVSMMNNAAPLYKAFGDAKIRLLRNADDPSQFVQVIEYQADPTIEFNRQKLASEPMVQAYLHTWRSLFPGAVEIDVYEDVTERA
jgi:hypothetical protein